MAAAQTTFTHTGTPASGAEPPPGDEGQHDHAHGLLRVVGPVGERHQRAGADLAQLEAPRWESPPTLAVAA